MPKTHIQKPAVRKPAQGWVSARHVRHMIARGESVGLRMDELLEEAGVAKRMLADADGLVPISVVEALFAAASRRLKDPLIGLELAADIQPATFGALGYISQACTSFADVIEVAMRYKGLLSNIGRMSVVFVPGHVQWQWECLAGDGFFKRQATDYVLGGFVTMARLLLPERTPFPSAVHFAGPRPADQDVVRRTFAFFKCPVYYDKPLSCIVIPSNVLKMKTRYGDAFMKDLLDRHARNLLREREQPKSLPDEVRTLIKAMIIEGVPTKDMVAMQMGTSARTLHRNLQELGTGYREILDEVRLEMAQARLRETGTAAQIAEQLGFLSQQAFLRWFRKSTGLTPGEYRKEHLAEAT